MWTTILNVRECGNPLWGHQTMETGRFRVRERERERERERRGRKVPTSRVRVSNASRAFSSGLAAWETVYNFEPTLRQRGGGGGVFNSYVFSVRFQPGAGGSVIHEPQAVFSIVTPAVSCGSHRAVGARLVLPSSPSPRGRGPTWSRRARYPPQPARVVAPPPGAASSKPVEPNPASRTNL